MHRRNVSYQVAFLFVFWLFAHTAVSAANNSSLVSSQLKLLTKQVLDSNALHSKYMQSSTKNAELRLQTMQANLADYPKEVLAVAFSQQVIKQLDASAQPFLEHFVASLKGTFISLCALGDEHAQRYYLKVSDHTTYAIQFVNLPDQLPKTGDQVIINQAFLIPAISTDTTIQGHLLVPPGLHAITKIGITPDYPTTGNFKTLVFLVNFQDAPTNKPYTVDSVKAMMKDINDYFYENSSQMTTLTSDVVGWYTIPYNSTVSCDSIAQAIVSSATAQATAAGIDVSSYQRRMFVFPHMQTCGWVGLGYIGGGDPWGITWINGYLRLIVMGHELGHNFGLSHAHALTCTGGAIGGTCNYNDSSVGAIYGDTADLMGNRFPGHFNAKEKEALGWLDNTNFPAINTVTQNGTFNLAPYEALTADFKAIRIPKTSPVTNNSTYYYLEYRQPIGFDAALGSDLTKGILIHEAVRGDDSSTYLLDAVPDGGNFSNAALAPGNSFNDPNAPGGGVTVSVNSADTKKANVTITFETTSTCVRAAPVLTVTPSITQWINAGAAAAYTITLLNKDSANCGNSNFNISAAPVAGVTSTLSANTVSAAPGLTASTTLQIQSTTATLNGVYSIQVSGYNAASPTMLGAGVANLGVQSTCSATNPTLLITPSSQSGSAGGTVNYSVSLSNKNSAACAAITYSLTTLLPTGLTGAITPSTLTLNSNATASATLNLVSFSTTPAATYTVSAKATDLVNSSLSASASSQYVVTSNCIYAAPTVAITPASQNSSGTAPITYNFAITNNHSAACGYGLFRFSRQTDDPNLSVSMSTNGELLLPGKTYSGKVTVTPTVNTRLGTHNLSVTTDVQGGTKLVSPYIFNYSTLPTCIHANPVVSLSPSSQSGPSGGTVSYAINVTNKDSEGCAAQGFNLSTVLPTNLTGSITPAALTLSPGVSAPAVLKVTSPSTTPAANYNLSVKVTSVMDASFNNIASALYTTTSDCVYAPPTVSITPLSQTTSGSNPVNYSFTITNNHTNACGYGLFRFAMETDDYNVKLTMNTNGELLLPGKSFTSNITVTPNLSANLGNHILALKTAVQDGSIIKSEFNLLVTKPNK
jgi:hypothetical protein